LMTQKVLLAIANTIATLLKFRKTMGN